MDFQNLKTHWKLSKCWKSLKYNLIFKKARKSGRMTSLVNCCSIFIFSWKNFETHKKHGDRRLKNEYIVNGNPLITFDGPRADLGLVFREFRGCFKKCEPKHISFWQNLIIEDGKLKCKYIVYRWPIIKFKKIYKKWSQPWFGAGFWIGFRHFWKN